MVVMLAFVGALLFWQFRTEKKNSEELLRTAVSQRQATLQRVNRIVSRSMENFALEQSRSTLGDAPTLDAIQPIAQNANVDVVGYYQTDGDVAVIHDLKRGSTGQRPMISKASLDFLITNGEKALFFELTPQGPLQCAFTPLAADANGAPSGYLIVGRFWDRLFMTNLGMSAETLIQRIPIAAINETPTGFFNDGQEYRVTEIGVGAMGQPVLAYTATFGLNQELTLLQKNRNQLRQISFAIIGVMTLFFAVLWKWLAYPIRLVSEALETDDPTVLKPILNEDYDWARIAQRLTEASEARLQLTREVQRQQEEVRISEENARVRESLARDLHDGVIQSVYAVGLQLERAHMMTSRNPDKAKERINECKDSLNGIIGELRGFIRGLTPAPLQGKSLQDALEQLVIHTRKSTEANIHIHISPEACKSLNTAKSLEIYQLSRELLSNAIRHAQAKNIHVRLLFENDSVDLLVFDDGIGMTEGDGRPDSRGMTNIRERTRQIGANVKFSKNSPQGTRIRIILPLNKP